MPLEDSEADIMTRPSIVILGSGIAGLTLGRCLRQKGIPSVIYEAASSTPRNAYGITLEPGTYHPLLKTLDMDTHTFRRRLAVDRLYHDGMGKPYPEDQPNIDDTAPLTSFRASRNRLEALLREGQVVHLDHALSSARLPEGQSNNVELSFRNGLKLTPTVVVDTMGVHSQLRKSLLPSTNLDILPYVVFRGKRLLNNAQFQDTFTPTLKEGNCITLRSESPHKPRLEISINDHLPNGSVSINYTYSRAAATAATAATAAKSDDSVEDRLHSPTRTMAGATVIPQEFYEELQACIDGQKQDHEEGQGKEKKHKTPAPAARPFLDTFNPDRIRTDNDRLLHWLMRTLLVPEHDLIKLLQYGVVMIGDSAHATPILGGKGANYAIADAVELAGLLEKSKAKEKDGLDQDVLGRFYRQRWPDWRSEVEGSRDRIAEMHAVPQSTLKM